MRGSNGRGLAAFLGVVLLATSGCSPRPGADPGAAGADSDDLVATLVVETGAEAVGLTLHVTNTTTAPIELEFTSGQRFDFQVTDAVGETLWTWSADKSFMQALGTETLAPGASLRYSAEWPSAGRTGDFIGVGQVTSVSHPVRQSVRFELGGGT